MVVTPAPNVFTDFAQRAAETALRVGLPVYERLNPGPARLGSKLALAPVHTDPVVLVPGFANGGSYLDVLKRSLEQDGFRVFVFDDPHLGIGSIETAARGLGGVIDAAKAATKRDRIDLVTYSAGATVARTYTSLQGGARNIDALVALDGSWRGDDDSRLINRVNRAMLGGFIPRAFHDLQRTSPLNQRLAMLPNAGIPDGVHVTSVYPAAAKASAHVPGARNVQISDRIDHADLPRRSDEAYVSVRRALLGVSG